MMETPVARVGVTPAAAALLHKLQAQHGPLVFHQSGGCCDGSTPMCFPRKEFRIGQRDVYLGTIADTPFYIGDQQFEHAGAALVAGLRAGCTALAMARRA